VRIVLPHPSGLCRLWNQPDSVMRARAALQEAGLVLAVQRQRHGTVKAVR
jgi:hypothetical protein